MTQSLIIGIALGYLCGSIPFALLLGWSRGVDIRTVGSGNVGATNVGRTLGRKWGIACFILDVFKGLLPVLFTGWWMGLLQDDASLTTTSSLIWLASGVAAVLGHVFPVWLKFKGGKGVATALGVLLGFWPVLTVPGLLAAITWAILAKGTRYISVASVGAAALLPVYLVVLGLFWRQMTIGQLWPFLAISSALALLVIVRHRSNIARLRAGTEPKWGQRKAQEGSEASPADATSR